MYPVDYHMHTICSPDGKMTISQAAERAIQCGLREVCFTDHVDCFRWEDMAPRWSFDWLLLQKQYEEAQEKFGDRIRIKLGAELGDPAVSYERTAAIMGAAPPLDYILGSIHMASQRFDYLDLYFMKPHDIPYYRGIIEDYLDNMEELCRWGQFHILAHCNLPLRYIKNNAGVTMTFDDYMDRVEGIFRTIIAKGIGIELNTNKEAPEMLPGEKLLKFYRELGGEIITLGSDAHKVEHIGRRTEDGMELLRQCGFRYLTTFTAGKPEFRPL